jgi:integrase
MKVQQELMRHADIRTTMNVYGKVIDASKGEAHGKVAPGVSVESGVVPLRLCCK